MVRGPSARSVELRRPSHAESGTKHRERTIIRSIPEDIMDTPEVTDMTPPARETWRAKFIAALAVTANVSAAARAAGIARQHVYVVRNDDPEFAAAWDDALETAVDELELAARYRALEGVERS